MTGSELTENCAFLMRRASRHLDVRLEPDPRTLRLARIFIGLFGIPEIGLHLRMHRVVGCLPADVGRLVDVGSGAGMLLGEIDRSRRYVELAAIEMDPESAAVSQAAHPYARVTCDDVATASRSMGGHFDFAVAADVLQFIPDGRLDGFLRACAALLKPGGQLIIHVPAAPQRRFFKRFGDWRQPGQEHAGFTADSLGASLRRAGLEPMRIAPTVGSIAGLAWELNMLATGSPIQAPLFPLLLMMARLGESLPCRRHNALLFVSRRP